MAQPKTLKAGFRGHSFREAFDKMMNRRGTQKAAAAATASTHRTRAAEHAAAFARATRAWLAAAP
jgi:hypothetical protein